MDEKNYEDILKRRQERWKDEKKRRRKKVLLIYGLILIVVAGAGIAGAGLWRRHSMSNSETSEKEKQESSSEQDPQKEESAKTPGKILAWIGNLLAPEEKGILEGPLAFFESQQDEEADSKKGESAEDAGEKEPEEGETGPDLSTEEGRLEDLLTRAENLAAGYDYEGAISLLQENEEFSENPEVVSAAESYESTMEGLVEQDVTQITHVFFHSLIIDPEKAFDGDSDSKGYNQVMTTKDEFLKILNEMYRKGYVLVRLHDLAHEETGEDGVTRMVKGKIMLPEGKKAFVMSQDDLCYYPYMDGDGFARRIIIGKNGKPTCEMVMDDGTVATGDYDLVPILERFIEEHPDFSYKGARAVLAFTGYEGILGYRTASSYQDSPTYEEDCRQAAQVAQCLRDNGWELASHSWGHRYLGQLDIESFKTDTDKWEAEVESLIGPTDIILYPFGDDISDWHNYTEDNEKYEYLREKGFRYFCTVDSSPYWVQIGDDYLRQGRRNLDGYRMWQDIAAAQEGGSGVRRLDDLFRAEDVFDPARPTPVVWN